MKIIVTGSREELTGFIKLLIADKLTTEKNEDLPPLLTKLAEDEKINESAKRRKENAPQAETAGQETKMIVDMLSTMNSIAHSNQSEEK